MTELIVALALNMVLFAALITVFLSNLNHYRLMIASNRLNQQLQAVLLIMSNDIRRAGYWANARNDIGLGQNNNPFVTGGYTVSTNSPTNNCILFAYDQNANGTMPGMSSSIDDERYGFRLQSQAIQARTPGAAFSCAASASSWENMTDPNLIQITNLTFTLTTKTITTGPATQGIAMDSVDISITGQLTSTPSITRTLTQHIRIRNDRFIP